MGEVKKTQQNRIPYSPISVSSRAAVLSKGRIQALSQAKPPISLFFRPSVDASI